MEFNSIKKLFYALFMLDILAGVAVGWFMSVLHGVVVSTVLLILNITVYAIILKMQKIKEQNNGLTKERQDI